MKRRLKWLKGTHTEKKRKSGKKLLKNMQHDHKETKNNQKEAQ